VLILVWSLTTWNVMKKLLVSGFIASVLSLAVSAAYAQSDLASLVAAAKKEGVVNSLA
jgi:hypothetical protein